MGGGVDARARIDDAVGGNTRLGELHAGSLGDVDAGASESRQGERTGELRVELVGDGVADLVAVAADARSERGRDALRRSALGHHRINRGTDDAALQALAPAVSGADHAGLGVGHQHRQAIRSEHAQSHTRARRDLPVRLHDGRGLRLAVGGHLTGRAGHIEAERGVQMP